MLEPLKVENLTLGYGTKKVLTDINLKFPEKKITVVIGGSGSGKSTLLKGLLGLLPPIQGKVFYNKDSLYEVEPEERADLLRHVGVLYQGGALWSDRTVGENVAFPLEEFTELPASQIRDLVRFKLSLVGLEGAEKLYPDELSGGMRKRASLARAMALDPEILFLDEPSAGLDPLNARRLDQLILQLREALGTSFIVITHDLESIRDIAQHAVFLEKGKVGAVGTLKELENGPSQAAQEFLRGYANA